MATKRRGNGEGTCFLESPGVWVGEISLGMDPKTGKRIRRRVRGETKEIVRKALDTIRGESEYGVSPDRQTLASFLDAWLENVIKPNRRVKTYEVYSDACRVDIKPILGTVKVQDMRRQDVERLLGTMARNGRSASLRCRAYRALSSAMKTANLTRDVFQGVERPRMETQKPEIGKGVWSPEDARKFLAVGDQSRNGPLFRILFSTGARIGEILALHRDDVDLKAGVLHIRHTLTESRDAGAFRSPTKTKAGTRSISLSPSEVRAFTQQYAMLLSEGLGACEVVFPSVNGTYQNTSNVRRTWNTAAKAAGLQHAKVHSARHASASYLLAEGVDIPTVSKRLGHSRASVTLDVYAAALPQRDQEAAVKLEGILGGGQ